MDQSNALSLRGGGLVGKVTWPQSSDWLIRDEFTDTRAAGSVNGTAATPGPGTRAATDTENKLSVGSGVLAVAGGKATSAYGDPGIWYGAQTRAAGLAVVVKTSLGATGVNAWGADSDATGIMGLHGIFTNSTTDVRVYAGGQLVVDGGLSGSTDYKTAVVLRTSGAMYFIKGGAYTEWTLLYITKSETTTPVYPGISNYNRQAEFDYLRCIAFPAPFDTDDGLATDVLSGSVAAGTTFTHESDFVLEFTVTTLTSASTYIHFRRVDANNLWFVQINSSGDLILRELVSGAASTRGTAAGVVSTGHRVVIIADGTTIKGYSNNTLRWTYSSASNYVTATAGKLDVLGTGGTVSDLKTWPRTLSGTAASILDKVSA